MTTNQHPGGVAGWVLDEEYNACAIAGYPMFGSVMHHELSREARAILGEWDSYIARIKDDTEMHPDEKDEVLAEAITEQSAQRRAFTHLGLDLESEDE